MQAKKAEIVKWASRELAVQPDRIGLEGSATQVIKIFTPLPRVGGEILQGELGEMVDRLVELLRRNIT